MENVADRPKVLVVDDDEMTRKLFSDSLNKQYDVITASSTEEGMRLYVDEQPAAVVLDVILPGRDGIEGLKFIRSMSESTCVIMITGCPKVEYFKSAISQGASYFMEKPISPDELRRTVGQGVEAALQELRRTQVFNEMTMMVNELHSKARECEALSAELSQAKTQIESLEQGLWEARQGLLRTRQELEDHALAGHPRSPAQLTLDISLQQAQLREQLETGAAHSPAEPIAIGQFVHEVAQSLGPDATARQVEFDVRFRSGSGSLQAPRTILEPALRIVIGQALHSASCTTRSLRLLGLEYPSFFEFRMEYRPPSSMASDPNSSQQQPAGFDLARQAIEKLGGHLNVQHRPGAVSIVSCRIPVHGTAS